MTRSYIYKLLLGVLMLSALLGCRAVEHYLYKDIEMPLFEGRLEIKVGATPKDYDINDKRLTKYEAPYRLSFRFHTGLDEKLSKLRISDVTLESQKSQEVITLSAREKPYMDFSKTYKDLKTKFISVMVGYEGETRNWIYEPYILKAKVQIYRDDNQVDEQDIEVLLKPDFKKSRRSDKFDGFMSV